MYHIYNSNDGEEILKLINMCMKEGFSNATIVPGMNNWVDRHEIYLPHIFRSINRNFPNVPIEVCHYSSYMPEIVGYKGKVYVIPNKTGKNIGQNSFTIQDVRTYTTFAEICNINTLKDLEIFEEKLEINNLDNEINKILKSLVEERKSILSKIENCKTQTELLELAEIYDSPKYFWTGHFLNIDKNNYSHAFKRQSHIIAENEMALRLL